MHAINFNKPLKKVRDLYTFEKNLAKLKKNRREKIAIMLQNMSYFDL